MYNLLVEPLIRVRCKDGTKTALSLPAVLAGLSTGDLDAFIGLMRHQRHAWHAFLVQLAAIALDRAGKTAPPKKEAEWRDLLKTLTREYKADEPWSLVVEDVLKPAFMQPPVPEKSLDRAGFGNPSWFTDDLDILVTSKSHDVKMHRVRTPEVDHWSYALVTLQTCQGFLGAGNYGISRMNGGFASRPGLGFRHGHSWSEHFQRDVRVLLSSRSTLLQGEWGYQKSRGTALLWLEPWNGKMTLRVRDLDPFYIEICRRVRIVGAAGRLCFRAKPTKSARVEAKVLKGNTGDSWTPVDVKRGAALTVSRNGFDYKKVREILLSGNFKLGGALEIRSDDPVDGLSFHATALTRGQGKTEGLHERAIPVPKNVRSMMLLPGQRERLTKISQRRIEDASLLEQKVLWPSLSRLGLAPDWANRWSHALDRRIDDIFFGELWNSVEEDEDHAREAWLRKITEMGRETLRAAERAAPIPAARRLRAIAEAELMYEGTLRKRFPELHTKEGS